MTNISITRRLYEAFANDRLDEWDELVDKDVLLHSTLGRDIRGLDALKGWAAEFIKAFRPRIDLVDEFGAGDRALFTVNIHWQHVDNFFDLTPSDRRGTSVETFILTLRDGKVIKWEVGDMTLDLVVYLAGDRGLFYPQNVIPEPIIEGAYLGR